MNHNIIFTFLFLLCTFCSSSYCLTFINITIAPCEYTFTYPQFPAVSLPPIQTGDQILVSPSVNLIISSEVPSVQGCNGNDAYYLQSDGTWVNSVTGSNGQNYNLDHVFYITGTQLMISTLQSWQSNLASFLNGRLIRLDTACDNKQTSAQGQCIYFIINSPSYTYCSDNPQILCPVGQSTSTSTTSPAPTTTSPAPTTTSPAPTTTACPGAYSCPGIVSGRNAGYSTETVAGVVTVVCHYTTVVHGDTACYYQNGVLAPGFPNFYTCAIQLQCSPQRRSEAGAGVWEEYPDAAGLRFTRQQDLKRVI